MGERYYITGVQIGLILAELSRLSDNKSDKQSVPRIKKLLDRIQEKQFIGNTDDKDGLAKLFG